MEGLRTSMVVHKQFVTRCSHYDGSEQISACHEARELDNSQELTGSAKEFPVANRTARELIQTISSNYIGRTSE